MKALTLLFLLVLISDPLRAEESNPDRKSRTGVLVKLQVLSGKKALLQPLMRALLRPAEKSSALSELEKLVKDGSVEVASEITGESLPDEEFTSFQGETLAIGADFENPEVLTPRPDPKATPLVLEKTPPAFGFAPTRFEVRKIGTSLTITPTLTEVPEQFIVFANWSRSWLVQWDEFEFGRLPNNEKILVKQPRLGEATSKGTFAVASGEQTVLGFHSVPGTPARSELVLLEIKSKPAPAR